MIRPLSLVLGALLLVGFTEPLPQPKPLAPAEAAKQGKELAAAMLAQSPAQNFTNTGVLKIHGGEGQRTEIWIEFKIVVTKTNWQSIYAYDTSTDKLQQFEAARFKTVHTGQASHHFISIDSGYGTRDGSNHVHLGDEHEISGEKLFAPFAGSDFWLCDLGLEFLHWPEQRILKVELRKTLSCKVLESTNPHPTPGSYSRVVSWIDSESGGLIHADAYDFDGKWLKEFDPKSVKEVEGQPQLVKMEMYNRQTRSRSQIEFDLNPKSPEKIKAGE